MCPDPPPLSDDEPLDSRSRTVREARFGFKGEDKDWIRPRRGDVGGVLALRVGDVGGDVRGSGANAELA